MADPGFPVGGRPAIGGDGRRPPTRAIFAKTYAKMKELDPVAGEGACQQAPLPGSTNAVKVPFSLQNFNKIKGEST